MEIVFNNKKTMSLNFTQIKTKIRNATGTDANNYPDSTIALDANVAMDDVFAIILKNNGWNVDDFNQSDYPIIYADLTAGQRSYAFLRDESGNLILGIYKVMVMGEDNIYREIKPVDQQSDGPTTMIDGQNSQGVPTTYDKTANGIFLDLIPSYSKTKGIKIFIDREPTYFVEGDTTKVPGFDGLCHDYIYLKPAYEYARDRSLDNREALYRDLQTSIAKINTRYGKKERDVVKRVVGMAQNNH